MRVLVIVCTTVYKWNSLCPHVKMENSFTVRKHKVLKAKKHKTRENSPDQKEKVLKKQRLLQNNQSIKKCKAA